MIPTDTTIIRGVTVISPPHPPRRSVTVVTRGDRIASVGPHDGLAADGSATVIDGTGRYLVPGLVDTHVHFDPTNDAVNRVLAAVFLGHGITTVLCMHGSAAVLRLREAISSGQVMGPAVLSTGPAQNDSQLTFGHARRRVHDQRRRGFDAIKVYTRLSAEGFDGICSAARELGMPVVGHIVRSIGTIATLGSYQSMIAHAEEFVYDYFGFVLREPDDREAHKLRLDRLPHLAEMASTAGITLVATLQHFAAIRSQATDIGSWMAQPEMSLLPAAVTRRWQPPRNRYATDLSQPHQLRRLEEAANFQNALIRAFCSAGVPVLAGTDALAPGSAPGVSYHRELHLLAASGMPASKVLEAATADASAFLRRESGQITVGAPADLLLVPGDPTADVANLQPLIGVVAAGRWLPAEAIWAEHAAALGATKHPGTASATTAPHPVG
jgi:imidazolonepropionase-like amidohydrolase